MKDEYRSDREQLADAHAWCLSRAHETLNTGQYVCIANVFVTEDDLKSYIQIGVDYQLVEAPHTGRSIHKVSAAILRRMEVKWVPTAELLK